MDEQGLPEVTSAELVADLEAILLKLHDRLAGYVELAAEDVIAADEGFNLAGQLEATFAEEAKHAADLRERLEEIHRGMA
jgi:hypothetical protein